MDSVWMGCVLGAALGADRAGLTEHSGCGTLSAIRLGARAGLRLKRTVV